MKIFLIVLASLTLVGVASLFVLAFMSKSGVAPGLVNGILTKCPDKRLCVCSEKTTDKTNFIDPISLPNRQTLQPSKIIKTVVSNMGGKLQVETKNYLAFRFASSFFGFVDDLEIRIDSTQQLIHLRSASRVGYNDAGVNRTRTEQLKRLFDAEISQINQSPDK